MFNRLAIILSGIIPMSCSIAEDTYTLYRPFSEESGPAASFSLDFSDTACIYSISLIVRLNKDSIPGNIRTDITLISPSGAKGSETVCFPSDYGAIKRYVKSRPEDRRIRIASTPDYYDISWKYRDNIIPPEYGQWEILISMPDMKKAIQGAGLTISKTPVNTALMK